MTRVSDLLEPRRVQFSRGPRVDLGALDPIASSTERVLRNYNARVVSRRGGILPAYATRTGDIPLPHPIRYDPMGYSYALEPDPAYAEYDYPELFGMSDVEQPELRTLPWEIDRPVDPAIARRARRKEAWSQAGLLVGVLGGALGIVLSLRALKGR